MHSQKQWVYFTREAGSGCHGVEPKRLVLGDSKTARDRTGTAPARESTATRLPPVEHATKEPVVPIKRVEAG